MITLATSIIGILTLALTPQLKAESINPIRFIHETAQISKLCDADDRCPMPYSIRNKYRVSTDQIIDSDLKKAMTRIAKAQAQVWGDTILEGDYAADGYTRLDRIDELFKYDQIIGYRITYSEKAWDTSDCSYDGIRDSTLMDCTPGRIVESSYVTPDWKNYFYDEKNAARFK